MIELAVAAIAAVCPARTLRGDVDGDGRRDTVTLTSSCTLRVGLRSVQLSQRRGLDDVPRLVRLAPINDRAGAEIVVVVDAGASADLLGVFTLSRGKITRMTINGKPASFAVGGTVAQRYGVDCEAGLVLARTAWAAGKKFRLEVRGYTAEGTTFAPLAISTQTISAASFLAFRTSGFEGCR